MQDPNLLTPTLLGALAAHWEPSLRLQTAEQAEFAFAANPLQPDGDWNNAAGGCWAHVAVEAVNVASRARGSTLPILYQLISFSADGATAHVNVFDNLMRNAPFPQVVIDTLPLGTWRMALARTSMLFNQETDLMSLWHAVAALKKIALVPADATSLGLIAGSAGALANGLEWLTGKPAQIFSDTGDSFSWPGSPTPYPATPASATMIFNELEAADAAMNPMGADTLPDKLTHDPSNTGALDRIAAGVGSGLLGPNAGNITSIVRLGLYPNHSLLIMDPGQYVLTRDQEEFFAHYGLLGVDESTPNNKYSGVVSRTPEGMAVVLGIKVHEPAGVVAMGDKSAGADAPLERRIRHRRHVDRPQHCLSVALVRHAVHIGQL